MIFDKSADIDHRTIGGEAFVITTADSQIHSFNPVGTFVFDRCDGKTSVDALVRAVTLEFEVDEPTARRDVEQFCRVLEARGMLKQVGQ